MNQRNDFRIVDETIIQPVRHAGAGDGSFVQRVKMLIPEGVADNPIVFFCLGNESALSNRTISSLYRGYGARRDMIILLGEHRGYGRSIAGDDQSHPAYVSIEEALADYHEIRLKYGERYGGPWIVGGYSYGGGLSIAYAHRYPEDCAVVHSSSGVVDWDMTIPSYDLAVRENLGAELYERLCHHVDTLSPAAPFSANWYSREILYAFVTGLSQLQAINEKMLGPVRSIARLPTGSFIATLRLLDTLFGGGEAHKYASSNKKPHLTSAEAKTERYSWRVWRYQQAVQTGTFWAPAPGESIYRRTIEDWREECSLLFGSETPIFTGSRWDVRALVPALERPLIYVRGGRDPWRALGLAPDYPLKKGKILSYEKGFHCPDRGTGAGLVSNEKASRCPDGGTGAGLKTIETILEFLR